MTVRAPVLRWEWCDEGDGDGDAEPAGLVAGGSGGARRGGGGAGRAGAQEGVGDLFGNSVALSAAGRTALIGSPFCTRLTGTAYVFTDA